MTLVRCTPTILFLVLAAAASCKKTAGPTETPDAGKAGATAEPEVPQLPDPPEIGQGRDQYLRGEHAAAVSLLGPLFEDLKSRRQYRAGGLAGAWLALAHARDVNERGQGPAQHAQAMGAQTGDPEVVAAGNLAWGAFLLGNEDFDAAAQSFDAVARSGSGPVESALAHLLHAETMLGRAYGGGESTDLQRPQDLGTAAEDYRKALEKAAGAGPLADALAGRAEEGLAAVAKYQGDDKNVCTHAKAAKARYEAANATPMLREGPEELLREARCTP